MSVIGPKKIDLESIQKSVANYARDNYLTPDEANELMYISEQFAKCYNKMSDMSGEYTINQVIEIFEERLKEQKSELKTRANLFYKDVDALKELIYKNDLDKSYVKSASSEISSLKRELKAVQKNLDDKIIENKRLSREIESKRESTTSSSLSRPIYSGGYCGGGFSGGGHC